jgi:hypothetical protein
MDTLRPHWSESQSDLVLPLLVHHRDFDTWRDTQGPDSASSSFWGGCLCCDIAKVAIISREEDLARSGYELNMNFYKNIFLYFEL